MSRIIDVPNGDDTDRVRICDEHGWASLPHPKELQAIGLTPRACPTCEDYDGEAGRARYRRLSERGLTCMSEHTPWTVLGRVTKCEIGNFTMIGHDDQPPTAYVANSADAVDICRCRNDRAELLAALKALVTRCDGDEGVREDGSNIDTCAARAAIAKAEGRA